MERDQWRQIAVGAGVVAVLVAIAGGRLPRRARITLVLGLIALAIGGGLLAYRWASTPTTLTLAAGSVDGDVPRFMSAIATRMAAAGSPVRIKVIDKGTALEAVKTFSAGGADLVVARADVGDLSAAKSVLVITHAVALIMAPPGSSIESIDGLTGKTVGVVGGEINHRVVEALVKEYELDRAKVQFKDLPIADVAQALKSKQVAAVLMVVPVAEKYLALLRNLFPKTGKTKPALIPIEAAGAIAAIKKYYESYELPKGTLQGSPPVPDDDMTTLRVPFYLLANKKLPDDVVGALAKGVMEARRDLLSEYPLLAQIKAPSTDSDDDKDTFIPVHPGAAAYFDGDQKTFFDKYGDPIFYGSMLLGGLASMLAAAWKYMIGDEQRPEVRALTRLYALTDQIGGASSEAELAGIERQIDEILKAELQTQDAGVNGAGLAAVLSLATHRLEHLIEQRRAALVRLSPTTATAHGAAAAAQATVAQPEYMP